MEARFRPKIQAPHGCEPLGALEYPIGWIEWPDYEDQPGRGQCKEADQHSKPNLCGPNCYFANSTRGAASKLGGKKLKFNWDEETEPWMRRAEVGGAVYVREVYGEAEGEGGGRVPRAAGRREN